MPRSAVPLVSLVVETVGHFSTPDLHSPPAGFDASVAKPVTLSWREWCDPLSEDDMDVPLTNRSLALQRDTPWLQLRGATLDTLEFVVPIFVPQLWQPGVPTRR
jgi:hypothetical protein